MHFFSHKSKADPTSPYEKNIIAPATKLIDSLRPMFAATEGVDEARLNVSLELFHDSEPDIAFDSIMENLNDINFEAVSAPIPEEQAILIKLLISRLYSDNVEKAQEYLAIVNRITATVSADQNKPSYTSHKNSLGLRGLHRFFFMHFHADWLEDMESIEEAIQMYLKEGLDPRGVLLLKEIDELLAKNMHDDDLSALIEDEWDVDVESSDVGSWKVILQKMHDILADH